LEDRKLFLFTAAQIVAVGTALWYVIALRTPWNAQRIAGTALLVLGVSGIVAARIQLGRSFSLTAQARKLVTAGIYSKIRNPIYVFGAILFAGLILILERPVLWIFFVILMIGQTLRARREAKVLEAAFGDEYREYRKKTWF
jgi:protein-S-isoprenylcysteine O-methyltransferase Ste14